MDARRKKRLERAKKLTAILLAVFLIAFLAVFFYFVPFRLLLPADVFPARQEGELRIHFLYLEGGECTAVEFPDGEVLVINAGDGSMMSDNKVSRYLRGLRPERHSLLATDTDASHVGGMASLLELSHPDCVYLPAFSANTTPWERFLKVAEERGCPTQKIKRYDVITNPSGAYLVCLSPYSLETGSDENEASVMLYLNYAGVSVLLSGDATSEREGKLLAEYTADSTVFDVDEYTVNLESIHLLHVAAHGSASASSASWINLLSPKDAVVSCNRKLQPAYPALTLLSNAGAKIYRTDELKGVVACISNGSCTVYPHYEK